MKIVPKDCRYVGIDLSPNMARLAASRLTNWVARTTVILSNGSSTLPEADGGFDHFVSNYFFDLLGNTLPLRHHVGTTRLEQAGVGMEKFTYRAAKQWPRLGTILNLSAIYERLPSDRGSELQRSLSGQVRSLSPLIRGDRRRV
jgi:hypothetical protein